MSIHKPAFSAAEYARRLEMVQREIKSRDLDLMLFHSLASICYLTGFQTLGSYGYGHYVAVVPAEGHVTLFSSDFESHNAKVFTYLTDIVTYDVTPRAVSPVEQFAGLLKGRGLAAKRMGYEASHYSMTVDEFTRLRAAIPEAELVEATDILDDIRIVKSTEEVAVTHRAAALTTSGMLAAIEATVEGCTDNDIANAAYDAIISGGGEWFSLQPIVTTGKRSGIPHTTFRRTPVQRGDVAFIECSSSYERYSAPCLRAVSVGPPSSDVQRAFEACLASVETILAGMKAGASGRELATKAGAALRSICPELLWHGYYSYSVGLGFPVSCGDCPVGDITEHAELILKANMVFHVNTSLRRIGEFGVTCGDTVLVTDTGCEVLTSVPRILAVK